jgi:hypothetical protein
MPACTGDTEADYASLTVRAQGNCLEPWPWAGTDALNALFTTLTSSSHSEYPGQRSCSSPRSSQSAQPQLHHSRPRSPRPLSLQMAHGEGPGGQCWAVETESTDSVSVVSQYPKWAPPAHHPRRAARGQGIPHACCMGCKELYPPMQGLPRRPQW